MPEHASPPWVAWILPLLWLALCVVVVRTQWRVVLHGADRPWSMRLFAGGYVAGVLTGGGMLLLIPLQLSRSWAAVLVGGGVVLALLLLAAGLTARTMEIEQTRRRQRALGLRVPPRMVPPWLVAVFWLLLSMAALLVAALACFLLRWPQPVTEQSTFQDTFDLVVLSTAAVCLMAGAGHVYWQHRRRERARAQAVCRTETQDYCLPERSSQVDGNEAEDGEHADE